MYRYTYVYIDIYMCIYVYICDEDFYCFTLGEYMEQLHLELSCLFLTSFRL